MKIQQTLISLSGVVLAVIGLILLKCHSSITDIIIDSLLVFTPTSIAGIMWENPNLLVKVDIYLFNWTNPSDFKNASIKPVFQELGPYTFLQKIRRSNVVYNSNNNTITYRNNKTFHFIAEESSGSLDDYVTNIDFVSAAVADRAKNWNLFLRMSLAAILNGGPYESTHKVGEILFDGYDDNLLKFSDFVPFIDNPLESHRFGYLYKRNGSTAYEGTYNIGSGLGNTTVGELYQWNYANTGPYPGKCGEIRTSAADIFKQYRTKDKLEFFLSDLCRAVVFDYNDTVSVSGIEGYKYVAGRSFLDTGTYNPDRHCLRTEKYLKFGVVDFSLCKYNAPIYISLPHFLKADPFYTNNIVGMKPNEEEHSSYFTVNPRMGTLLNLSLTFQLNLMVEPIPKISKYSDVPEVMFPLVWIKARSEMDLPVKILIFAGAHLPTTLIILSIFLFISGVLLVKKHFSKDLLESNKYEKKCKLDYPLLNTKDIYM